MKCVTPTSRMSRDIRSKGRARELRSASPGFRAGIPRRIARSNTRHSHCPWQSMLTAIPLLDANPAQVNFVSIRRYYTATRRIFKTDGSICISRAFRLEVLHEIHAYANITLDNDIQRSHILYFVHLTILASSVARVQICTLRSTPTSNPSQLYATQTDGIETRLRCSST